MQTNYFRFTSDKVLIYLDINIFIKLLNKNPVSMTEGLAQWQSNCLVSICEAVVLSLHIKINKESEYISFFPQSTFMSSE